MRRRTECPNCESWDTEQVHTEWRVDTVLEVRTCECGTEFENEFADPVKKVTREP